MRQLVKICYTNEKTMLFNVIHYELGDWIKLYCDDETFLINSRFVVQIHVSEATK